MRYITRIVLISIFSIIFVFSNAQESVKLTAKEQRKADKALKKKEKEEKESAEWLSIKNLAESQRFVIEFDKVISRRTGEQFSLNRGLNFLSIKDNWVVIQIETHSYYSQNGLGGMTFNGLLNDFKYKPPKNDKKPIFLNFDVLFRNTVINVSVTIYKGGTTSVTFGTVSNVSGIFVSHEDANINTGVDMWN